MQSIMIILISTSISNIEAIKIQNVGEKTFFLYNAALKMERIL